MSERFVVSGKRFAFGAKDSAGDWKFTRRPGGWIVADSADGKRIRFMALESGKHFSASIHGQLLFGELQQDRRHHAGAEGGGDADLTAQFPGKVRKILVKAGQDVKSGEPLILIEAMKMEFSIKAPDAGKVAKVLVTEGQQLSPGDRFFDFVVSVSGESGNG